MTAGEWLVADGLGGYATGTADGIRTRRYHALLLVAAPDSERRFVLVNGVEAWLETEQGTVPLTSQRYVPDVVHPDSARRIASFTADPWPVWTLDIGGGRRIEHEVHGVHGSAALLARWRLVPARRGAKRRERQRRATAGAARLCVRLLISGRDWHDLHHENAAFAFDARRTGEDTWRWTPYAGVPPIVVHSNALYAPDPQWYRRFQYDEERARGLEYVEDLASPGIFRWELSEERDWDALLLLTTAPEWGGVEVSETLASDCAELRERERTRLAAFPSPLERAADAYVVRRGSRRTIIAGYPWFTDWGRDTFIALPGVCVATGRLADAEAILLSWSDLLSDGMLPNVFASGASAPSWNSVDSALWFAVAVRELSQAASSHGIPRVSARFIEAIEDILRHYSRGTRFGIRMDADGLLAAGAAGVALTWMDAVVDGVPVTPRIGKQVEVQALWINALEFASLWNHRWGAAAARARDSFGRRFWNERRGCLFDVVDADHEAGAVDDRVRPNQVLACGGLPVAVLDGARAGSVVDVLERSLWTPMGLRSLAPGEPAYRGRVDGPLRERDRGYHQGTVWPWLAWAFLDACARVRGTAAGRAAAQRYLEPLVVRADAAAGHVPEIADGDPPHESRGCPFQAWSVAALLRARASGG